MKYAVIAAVALLASGCVGPSGVIKALAKDPATACISVTTIYGTVKIFRTAIPNGTVNCNQDGMAVNSTPK
jgi:hypothetical protein